MKNNKNNTHTISMLVANQPGVLVRCAQVFARRGFNIDALVVSPSVNPKFSRMTITAQGNPEDLDQIIKQTAKLVDVVHCCEHSDLDALDRELALFKVKVTPATKAVISKQAKKYSAKVLDESEGRIILQIAGSSQALDEFETVLKKYGIIEMVRSGKLVMAIGREET